MDIYCMTLNVFFCCLLLFLTKFTLLPGYYQCLMVGGMIIISILEVFRVYLDTLRWEPEREGNMGANKVKCVFGCFQFQFQLTLVLLSSCLL